jgi:hypothetical protein
MEIELELQQPQHTCAITIPVPFIRIKTRSRVYAPSWNYRPNPLFVNTLSFTQIIGYTLSPVPTLYGKIEIALIQTQPTHSRRSFNSNRAHGTMLPSRKPLDHSDCPAGDIRGTAAAAPDPDRGSPPPPPPRISNGDHVTVTKRNHVAAEKHQRARILRQNLQEYWKS